MKRLKYRHMRMRAASLSRRLSRGIGSGSFRSLPEKITAAYNVLEPLPTAMIITDTFGSCVFANSRALDMAGYSEADMLGVGWLQFVHEADRPNFVTGWSRALSASTEYITRLRVVDADSKIGWVSMRARPLLGDDGEAVGQVGIFEPDALTGLGTPQVASHHSHVDERLDEQLKEQRRQLVEAERTLRSEREVLARIKDDFLCTVSHELRTPLHAILGWSQILSKQQGGDATVERSIEVIQRNGHALARLLEDMLDMKGVLSGAMQLCVEELDLTLVVQSVIASLSHAAQTKGVFVSCSAKGGSERIVADEMRLKKIVWNLLSNGVKFTPAGGAVHIDLQFDAEEARITVSDTGCGISSEFFPRLFEPFRQADGSTTRTHGGLGMGLSLTRHLVELHGGNIAARSQGLGCGATFSVVIPRNRDTCVDSGPPSLPCEQNHRRCEHSM
jgi:PAS domain S-box-containing protein